jgi:hypothetical protein
MALVSVARAAEISVVGDLAREWTLQPGAQAEDTIRVRNNTDRAQAVKIYQTDYLFRADGTNTYGEPGSAPRSNCPWVTFAPREFEIPPRETARLQCIIKAPRDDKLAGTYWSMLMVEPVAASTDFVRPEDGKPVIAVKTVVRYGVQMVVNIGDSGRRDLRFLDKRLIADGDRVALRLDVENTGERGLRPTVWAELYNKDGVSAGRFGGQRLRIYPGCSARFDIDISAVPKGQYSALIVADNLDESVFGAQCKLRIE